jgi:hypothetical protein
MAFIAEGDTPSAGGTTGSRQFISFITDEPLVATDNDNLRDLYAIRSSDPQPIIVSTSPIVQNQANGAITDPQLSDDGRYAVFSSGATNVVPGDTNSNGDVFVRAVLVPELSSISQTQFAPGTATSVTITGKNLAGAVALPGGAGIAVEVVGTTDTQMAVTVTIDAGAAPGKRDITVALPGTGPGLEAGTADICFQCLEVL